MRHACGDMYLHKPEKHASELVIVFSCLSEPKVIMMSFLAHETFQLQIIFNFYMKISCLFQTKSISSGKEEKVKKGLPCPLRNFLYMYWGYVTP